MTYEPNDAVEVRHRAGWIAGRIETSDLHNERELYDVVLEDGGRLLNVPLHALRAAQDPVADARAIAVRLAMMPSEMRFEGGKVEFQCRPLACEAPECGAQRLPALSVARVFSVTHGGELGSFIVSVLSDGWTLNDTQALVALCPEHSRAAHRWAATITSNVPPLAERVRQSPDWPEWLPKK